MAMLIHSDFLRKNLTNQRLTAQFYKTHTRARTECCIKILFFAVNIQATVMWDNGLGFMTLKVIFCFE